MIKDLYELQQIEELVERIDKLRVEHNYSIYELAVKAILRLLSGFSFIEVIIESVNIGLI